MLTCSKRSVYRDERKEKRVKKYGAGRVALLKECLHDKWMSGSLHFPLVTLYTK